MTGYYDIILGLIPLAMGGVTVGLLLAGIGLTTALPIASIAAFGLIGHAMFVNRPVDGMPAGDDSDNRSTSGATDSPGHTAE
jgi:hypothetical protein